jgi:hypothetical protein
MNEHAVDLLPREERAHQGSEDITVWCPTCLERVVAMRNGTCGWCQTVVAEPASAAQLAEVLEQPDDDAPAVPVLVESDEPFPRRRDRRHLHGRPYSDEQLIARAHLWERLTGEPPAKRMWNAAQLTRGAEAHRDKLENVIRLLALWRAGDFPSETVIRERFGSWSAFMVACGWQPKAPGRQPRPGNDVARPRPKIGPEAQARYAAEVAAARESGDELALKLALYDLAMSAIGEADRIRVEV